jgi:hypothetical protein
MKKILFLMATSILLFSCNNFLDVPPKAVLTTAEVTSGSSVEGAVIAAYASLGNDHYDTPFSFWSYDGIRSGDSYKGGRDPNDIGDFGFMELCQSRVDMGEFNSMWFALYSGIARANSALALLNSLTDAQYAAMGTGATRENRMAECRFIRAHYYFQLKILFNRIPYFDETVPAADYASTSNTALTSEELWNKIAADFEYAFNNLPANQSQIGRVTKYAAEAYLAKTKLYQAYGMGDKVGNGYLITAPGTIPTARKSALDSVITYCKDIIANGGYRLDPDFADNFLPNNFPGGPYENGPESVFAIQYSVNDGTLYGRLDYGDCLATPMGVGCCDFHKPSMNLFTAFRTNAQGLPDNSNGFFSWPMNASSTFNEDSVPNLAKNTVDPRIDHTIAIPGHMFKYDPTTIYDSTWNRTPSIYGFFASLKENVTAGKNNFDYVHVGPFYDNDKNRNVIRYADVILWLAEAYIQENDVPDGMALINQIRDRAANSTGLLKYGNGQYESNYKIGDYPTSGVSQAYAFAALQWERRLEFALEGSRFFDLVRWGIIGNYLNSYYSTESQGIPKYLAGGNFVQGRDEFLPIPLTQIEFSHGAYTQNPGY